MSTQDAIERGPAQQPSMIETSNDTVAARGEELEAEPKPTKANWRLWGVLTPLLLSTFMAAIESTIISSALPAIVDQLHAGSAYVWFINAYLLAK